MSTEQEPVSVAHARHLISVYDKVPSRERPWYFEWALTIDALASALERASDALRVDDYGNPVIP